MLGCLYLLSLILRDTLKLCTQSAPSLSFLSCARSENGQWFGFFLKSGEVLPHHSGIFLFGKKKKISINVKEKYTLVLSHINKLLQG